ncbi:MAG: hypothetical protein US70_C0005G0043 [Parcubacteria group bacterium GW2011_GWD2_38_11]|nr:MAG: hypothetical protein US70_C0005G0043 [Parcubacteria group bacterium GW2011_GWD2_38_11]
MQVDKEVEGIFMKKSQKWLEAAERCDKSNVEEKIARATEDIQEFLESEHGHIALHKLLRATNKHVLFAKNNRLHPDFPAGVYILTDVGPMHVQIGLDSNGLIMLKPMPISIADLVRAAVEHANMMPHMVFQFLLEELDKIAASST